MENIIFDDILLQYSGKNYHNVKHHVGFRKLDNLDRVKDYELGNDFYNLNITKDVAKAKLNISLDHDYKIEGISKINDISTLSLVSLLTFDYVIVKTKISEHDGSFVFNNIPYNDYIIISEDLSLKYNHSIQVGVKPVAQD